VEPRIVELPEVVLVGVVKAAASVTSLGDGVATVMAHALTI
jgi:hypothetical protein